MSPPSEIVYRWPSRLILLLASGLLATACGTGQGPDYGVDPVERQALAVPPDLTAQPLATQTPFLDLPPIRQLRPGPQSAKASGEWVGRLEGAELTVPIPSGWALGTARAALLLQGIAIAKEREGLLRTGWLTVQEHRHLGVPPPSEGRIRYTLEIRSDSKGVTQLLGQGVRRDGDEVSRASSERVNQLLKALRPAFGKKR